MSADPANLDAGWDSLRIPYLRRLDQDEQDRIRGLSKETAAEVEPWVHGLSPDHQGLSWPLAVTIATLTPELKIDDLVPLVRFACWTFLFDDAFDNHDLTPSDCREKMVGYLDFLDGSSGPDDDILVAGLRDCRDELARYPLFEDVAAEWASALRITAQAMIVEADWKDAYARDPRSLPSYEEYVLNGIKAVDSQGATWAALAAIGDRSVLKEVEHLRAMNTTLARCIRLANDLRTYGKEALEGGINAVAVHARADAFDLIRTDITDHLRALENLASAPRTATGRAEEWISDCGVFVYEFYTSHEFRTLYDSET